MFLAIDECLEGKKKIVGGLLVDTNRVSLIEKDFTDLRIRHRLFGEIKWNNINQYAGRYCDFISLFFEDKGATFHAIAYSRSKYRAAYVLIRTITWKMQNSGIREPVYILFDNDGDLGRNGLSEIRKIAKKDKRFKAQVEFCNQGSSHVLGILQIADLLTACVSVEANNFLLNKNRKIVFNYVIGRNGKDLIFYSSRLPRLYDYKIHYFDPDEDADLKARKIDAVVIIPKDLSNEAIVDLNSILKNSPGKDKLLLKFGSPERTMFLPYGVNYSRNIELKVKNLLERR